MAKKKIQRHPGNLVAIPLGDNTYGYGIVLNEPLIAFVNMKSDGICSIEKVSAAPIAFTILVMNYAITDGLWPVIGSVSIPKELLEEPLFFKKDRITGKLVVYRDSTAEETPATLEECSKLECAAVWEPSHVVDRLRDHFCKTSK